MPDNFIPCKRPGKAWQAKDVADLLIDQIAVLAGPECEISLIRERPWASITFAGTRHRLEVRFPAAHDVRRIETICAALPDHEFNLPGHFVADMLLDYPARESGGSNRQCLKIEALTIIDPVLSDNRRNH